MCAKTIVFLLINLHIHHYFALNLLCIQENEDKEHDFFPSLFRENCLRNQMGLRIYLHFGCQRGGEYLFLKTFSGFNLIVLLT